MTARIGLIGTLPDPNRGGVAPELASLFPEVELVAYPSRTRVFPSSALERSIQEIGHAEAAFAAGEDGCSAVVIDSVGDYGLAAMRASLPVPAFGAGESGMAQATAGGRRFAIVSVWPKSMNFIIEGRLRDYRRAESCLAIVNLGAAATMDSAGGVAARLARVRGSDPAIVTAAARAIAEAASGGAEAILLGCTCMSGMAARLQALSPMPVVNPLAAAIAAAVRSAPVPAPAVAPGRRDMLRKMVDAVAGEPVEACPVCVAGTDV